MICAPSYSAFALTSMLYLLTSKKAFLQITLHEDDRNFTRFYWLNDPSDQLSKLDVYRFKTVLFGAVSSPFILYATLHHHLHQHNSCLSCDILHNLYVDNILSGCSSEADTIQYYHNARTLLSEACFNLRAWVTNSPQLRAITQQEMTANTDVPSNVLGLLWNPISDELSLAPKKPLVTNNPLITKRELLQESSSYLTHWHNNTSHHSSQDSNPEGVDTTH